MEDIYYVWSNQHHGFWGPGENGYTQTIEFAGEYSAEEAQDIVNKCTVNGQLVHKLYNPAAGRITETYDEVMVKKC